MPIDIFDFSLSSEEINKITALKQENGIAGCTNRTKKGDSSIAR